MTQHRGFTLVELMITLAVAAVGLTIAVPGFISVVKNNRQSTQINELVNALAIARSEAIKLNVPVSVCQSSSGVACTDTGWEDGWIVFSDQNTQGTVDGADVVVQVFGAINGQTTLTSASFADFITFASDGTSNSSGDFAMCDDRGSGHARSLCVSLTGRAYVSSTACGGGAITCP